MKKKVKIFILVCLLFLGISVTTTNTNFSQPAFASMGSTGGGHSTGGSSGGGTNYTSSDSSDDSNNSSIGGIVGGFAILVLIFFSSYIIAALFDFIFKVRLRFEYDSNYLIKNSGDNNYKLFYPNQGFDKYQKLLHRLHIKFTNPDPKDDFTAYKEVYIQAQFLYSQLLREKYVNSKYQVKSLKQYLDRNYYKAMVKEIELKRNAGTVDETVIDSVIFEEVAHLDKSLLLAKLTVLGKDKEIQFNQDFDASFSRNKWTDYVLFGLEDNRNPKIINLVYGEHFHLNGEDFNDYQSGNEYTENKIN